MKRLLLCMTLLLNACSGGTTNLMDTTPPQPDVVADLAAEVEVSAPEDNGQPEMPLPREETVEDLVPDFFIECEPGTGCFLDPCNEGKDCQSGYCVEHMGDAVCTESCKEECPAGWTCKLLSDSGPDAVTLCVSDHSNLCKPCAGNSDCKSLGEADDVCVSYGSDGSFCGGTCAFDSDCPWGFKCKQVETVEGVPVNQCFAEAGVCPCTQKSILQGLATPCSVVNSFGQCKGKRVCTQQGLSACDAPTPAAEACNGVDDDCDGEADEPVLVEGKYVEVCDDGNPCTLDSCLAADGCDHQTLDQGECIDGDACTVGDHCSAGECKGLPIACDDDNPCTDDACDGVGGCTTTFNTAGCDDGDPCTVADTCKQGVCSGYDVDCECATDADCMPIEDGNLCNGTLFCDTAKPPFLCAVIPESVVTCPETGDPASICVKTACNPATGKCVTSAQHEGFACDDGDPCTVGDQCAAGLCAPGVAVTCDDGNLCTSDFCLPGQGCAHQDNASVCNDGDVCTTNDVCAQGQCKGGKPLACDDGNPCTSDACDSAVGCVHAPSDGECTDGNLCTQGDHCEDGACTFLSAVDCTDGNPCTQDACVPWSGCTYTIIAAACDDGNPCTLNDTCINGLCTPGPAVSCDDGNPCTNDSCGKDGQCLHTPNTAVCNDGNACTAGDVCKAGKCTFTGSVSCDDGDVCTTDSCDALAGCLHTLNQAPCDDADLCTTGDHCHLGKCISSGKLPCNDSNPCTDDSCDPTAGCEFAPNTAACDDKNVCTQNDACKAGACSGGKPVSCDDANPCTDDLCDVTTGCAHFNNSVVCNDLNACTANEFCSAGSCGGGVPIVCDDKNPCTDDSCAAKTGCTFTNNTKVCSDGNACTSGDLCSGGTCVSGGPLDCNDANPCTTDSCSFADGCHHVPLPDQTPCGVGVWCKVGQCVPTLACDAAAGKKVVFTSSQGWKVPGDVKHVRVMVVGGGGGGAQGHGNGGGSGHVRMGEYDVDACSTIQITVGGGGTYNSNGNPSSFGAYKSASAGQAGLQNSPGSGAGGSGGGGAGNAGCGGNGGTGGSNGSPGCTYAGGAGGNFDNVTAGFFKSASMSNGQGGFAGTSSHAGGGGGGGVLIDGQGTGGAKGEYSWSAEGGKGYGGGGGGGGYNGPYALGGTAGTGVVYVEWD